MRHAQALVAVARACTHRGAGGCGACLRQKYYIYIYILTHRGVPGVCGVCLYIRGDSLLLNVLVFESYRHGFVRVSMFY